MTVRSKTDILSNIATDMADNNAGSISAADVRNNITDTVDSINSIIGSGDHDTAYPFINNLRTKKLFITESGVQFPDATQYVAYPGPGGISHNDLAFLTTADPHTQYVPISGSRPMTGGLSVGNGNWISESGGGHQQGLRFEYGGIENIYVSGTFIHSDSSTQNSAKGIAKAWINFNTSGDAVGTPVVNESYNILSLERVGTGQFNISFASGVFANNYYVAMGHANARHDGGTLPSAGTDFAQATVGLAYRSGDEATGSDPRKLTFYILDDSNTYVESELCDLVVFGRGSGVTADTAPSIVVS